MVNSQRYDFNVVVLEIGKMSWKNVLEKSWKCPGIRRKNVLEKMKMSWKCPGIVLEFERGI